MDNSQILKHYETTLIELKKIYEQVNKNGKIDLQEDNIYLGITFISKIRGMNNLFSEEFIKEYNLKSVVDWIDKKTIMIQATHYTDKNLFYEFFNVIYPQLLYRFEQIKYKNSLSEEEKKQLLITSSYQAYLSQCLKYYLEQEDSEEIQKNIKEILSIINLYKVCDDPNLVCLGSKITFVDSQSNAIYEGRIVLNSHSDQNKKLSLTKYKYLISSKKNDIVYIDYATSFFIKILNVDNSLETL